MRGTCTGYGDGTEKTPLTCTAPQVSYLRVLELVGSSTGQLLYIPEQRDVSQSLLEELVNSCVHADGVL